MHTDIQALMATFKQTLIDLVNTNSPSDCNELSLPELYAMAANRFPNLHQDDKLTELYAALVTTHTDAKGYVELTGINAWMNAGMSPIIYFIGEKINPLSPRRVPLSLIEQIWIKKIHLPERQQLLGNLSLAEFSGFLADRVSFKRMDYYGIRQLTAKLPELIEPKNWHNLTTGRVKISETFRRRNGQCLQALVPLLLIEKGGGSIEYLQAKHELNIHDPLIIESNTQEAVFDAQDERGIAVLERYVQAEYGSWQVPALDHLLQKYLHRYAFRTKVGMGHGEVSEQFWINKAAEVARTPDSSTAIWPAVVYTKFLLSCCEPDVSASKENFRSLLDYSPALKHIRDHVFKPKFPIIEAMIETDEFLILVHPVLTSQIPKADKTAYTECAAHTVLAKIIKNLTVDSYFLLNDQACDHACLQIMSRRANKTVNLKTLNLSARGHHCMLSLMSAEFRGTDQRERAIAWCAGINCQKTRLEAMRLLDLTLDDVSLKSSLHDEFLVRDLGL